MIGQMICAFGADDVAGSRPHVQKTTFSDDRQHAKHVLEDVLGFRFDVVVRIRFSESASNIVVSCHDGSSRCGRRFGEGVLRDFILHVADNLDNCVREDALCCLLKVIRDPPDAILVDPVAEVARNVLSARRSEHPDEMQELQGCRMPLTVFDIKGVPGSLSYT